MEAGKRIYWITAILFMSLAVLVFFFPIVTGTLGIIVKILVLIGLGGFIIFLILALSAAPEEQEISPENKQKGAEESPSESADENLFTERPFDAVSNFENYTNSLLQLLKETLVGSSAFIYFYEPEDHCLHLRSFRSEVPEKLRRVIPLETGYLTTIFKENSSQSWGDMGSGSPPPDYYETPGSIRSSLCAPIRYGNQPIGVIGIDSPGSDSYGEDDLQVIERFARIVGLAVENIEQLDLLEKKASFFNKLCKLITHISLATQLTDFYEKMAQFIRDFIPFGKFSYLELLEDDPSVAKFEYLIGYDQDYAPGHQIKLSGTIAEEITASESVFLLSDFSGREFRFAPGDLDSHPYRSLLGFTVYIDGRIHGILILENESTYTNRHRALLSHIGENFSAILERILLFRKMKNLATIDGLTNVYNHRAFKERFSEEIQRSQRYGTPLTLLILDLDKFKRVNDTFGHLFGDFVLRKTVQLIKTSVRTIDTVARYGGEEFAVILINATKETSLNTARRILNNIADFKYEQGEASVRMTISIGMAEYPGDGKTVQELIGNADSAMYIAKRQGGNTVIAFESQNNAQGE